MVLTPPFAALRAALIAGYLGSVGQALAPDRYEFGAAVRRHFVPLFLYQLAVLALGLVCWSRRWDSDWPTGAAACSPPWGSRSRFPSCWGTSSTRPRS